MHPTISIVIPTYNGAKFICETLESALNQTFTDTEIIVVDDGSDQDLRTLLSPYKGRIRYVRKERSGPAASRNLGLTLSAGEYVAFLDHDDLWHPDKLRRQLELIESNPRCSLVYCYPILIDSQGTVIPNDPPLTLPSGQVFWAFLEANRITTFSATLVRKSVFLTTGFLDPSPDVTTCDDYDMWLRIADVSEILFLPGAFAYYRIHAGNLLKSYELNMSAHLFVVRKAVQHSKTCQGKMAARATEILRRNEYNTYRRFALTHYYATEDMKKAGKLFWKAISSNPYKLENYAYFAICKLPFWFRQLLRVARRRLFFLPITAEKNGRTAPNQS